MSYARLSTGISSGKPVTGTAVDSHLTTTADIVFHIEGEPGTYLIISEAGKDSAPAITPAPPLRITNHKEREEFFRNLLAE